jgi:hypothetical protein
MQKEFIPYAEALELKELGFDEPCMAFYEPNNKEVMVVGVPQRYNDPSLLRLKDFCAPLYQQAFRWFRDKYNLNGILNHYPNTKLWDFSVHDLRWSGKEFIEHVKKEDRSVKYSTYEEAELACLNKLIEAVKTLQ